MSRITAPRTRRARTSRRCSGSSVLSASPSGLTRGWCAASTTTPAPSAFEFVSQVPGGLGGCGMRLVKGAGRSRHPAVFWAGRGDGSASACSCRYRIQPALGSFAAVAEEGCSENARRWRWLSGSGWVGHRALPTARRGVGRTRHQARGPLGGDVRPGVPGRDLVLARPHPGPGRRGAATAGWAGRTTEVARGNSCVWAGRPRARRRRASSGAGHDERRRREASGPAAGSGSPRRASAHIRASRAGADGSSTEPAFILSRWEARAVEVDADHGFGALQAAR